MKGAGSTDYTLHGSMYMTFWQNQNRTDRKHQWMPGAWGQKRGCLPMDTGKCFMVMEMFYILTVVCLHDCIFLVTPQMIHLKQQFFIACKIIFQRKKSLKD